MACCGGKSDSKAGCGSKDSVVEAPVEGDANGKVLNEVSDYYSRVLKESSDLKTNACTTSEKIPDVVKAALCKIHEEVLIKYYGCGIVAPQHLQGLTILDLGCGAGRDCYVLAQMVGENGTVIGVDMTEQQIEVARNHQDWHADKFGYAKPNTKFCKGYIEDLLSLGIKDSSVDVIVSNCVVNLSPNKEAVLAEAFRVLKPGGEMYFSDVYATQRVPKQLVDNAVLFGECLSGALYWNDFLGLAKSAGFRDPRLVKDSPIEIQNKEVEQLIGHINFYSATYRLFKIESLESDCEDYGQAVIYKGTIDGCPNSFVLDGHHEIKTGKVFPVCGNTHRMLYDTRFRDHFEFMGDMSVHYGIYADCGKPLPFASASGGGGGGGGGNGDDAGCC